MTFDETIGMIRAEMNSHLQKYHPKGVKLKPPKTEDCQKILDCWNSHKKLKSGWKTHRALLPDITEAIQLHLKKWTVEQICSAINNFAKVVHGREYRWNYRGWGLFEFLTRRTEDDKNFFKWCRFLPNRFEEYDWLTDSAKRDRSSSKATKPLPEKQPAEERRSMKEIYAAKDIEELRKEWAMPGGFGEAWIRRHRPEIVEQLEKEAEK